MPYILKVDSVMQARWDSLPPAASLALTDAFIAVCEDPIAATTPYGEDDGVVRTLALPSVMAVLLLNHQLRHVRPIQIMHLG